MLGIHLRQAGILEVDWDSFLRNITFCKVSAQKGRNHCWIYFPSHSYLWDWWKAWSLINLPLRPLSFRLPLDPITFVSTPRDLGFFSSFFFPYCNNLSAFRTLSQSYASRQKTKLGRNAWPPSVLYCHSPPLVKLAIFPVSDPAQDPP